MAATVQLIEKNGAGGTGTDKTSGNIRFKNADDATVDLNNPLVKPPSATTQLREVAAMNVTGGSYSQITNVVSTPDGSNGMGTGVEVYAKAVSSYSTPAEASSITGTRTLQLHQRLGAEPRCRPVHQHRREGRPRVLICRIDNTVSGGLTSSETITLAWDEI